MEILYRYIMKGRNMLQDIQESGQVFSKPICISYVVCLVFAVVVMPLSSFAQEDSSENNIFIIARPTPDSIMLRWAPGNYEYWQYGNQYGYTVVRYTILRDSMLLDSPQKQILTPEGIQAWELDKWETLVKTNTYGGVAAQALYGDSFEVDAGTGTTPEQAVSKSQMQKQRFSFALYAADVSPEVARASGLWLADTTVREHEMYLYRVFFNMPDSLAHFNDTAYIFTGLRDYTALPQPIELSAEFGDQTAVLSWNSFVHDNIYIAWDVERAGRDKKFQSVTIDPHVSVTPFEQTQKEYTYKYDSLPENNTMYQYRIRGITSFGERGPWSDVVRGKGIQAITASPNITGHDITNNQVILNWEFPEELESAISKFVILRSSHHNTGFEELPLKIKPSERTVTDKKPLGTNYYKVMAYSDKAGSTESFSHLVQLIDNTPPDVPQGLQGSVDSAGVVNISWLPNVDEDIYGYRVFRSVSGNDEFSQRTFRPIADTFYIDTVSTKDLNARVFYKIAAIDLRQNQSAFSDVVAVLKPDNIPPSAPVIILTQAQSEGIRVTWISSTDKDVTQHDVYRQIQGEDSLMILAELPVRKRNSKTEYIDKTCSSVRANQYTIVAVDKSGNISKSVPSIAVQGLRNTKRPRLQKINTEVDYEHGAIYLSWQKPDAPVQYIHVYRKINDTDYVRYETLDGNKINYKDYGMKIGNHYSYRLQVVYKDGRISPFSDEYVIEF
jgi:fibronectin type 3 domain-containing protein